MQLIPVQILPNIIGQIVLHIIVQVIVVKEHHNINILILEVVFVLKLVILVLQYHYLDNFVIQHVNIL